MGLVHNRAWYTTGLVFSMIGTKWAWYKMGLVCTGPETQQGVVAYTMGLVHNRA